MQWEALHDKLHEFSEQQAHQHHQQHDTHSNASFDGQECDGEETLRKKKYHEEFVKHRKDHYTEYEMMKRFRESHQHLEDDDNNEAKDGDVTMEGN